MPQHKTQSATTYLRGQVFSTLRTLTQAELTESSLPHPAHRLSLAWCQVKFYLPAGLASLCTAMAMHSASSCMPGGLGWMPSGTMASSICTTDRSVSNSKHFDSRELHTSISLNFFFITNRSFSNSKHADSLELRKSLSLNFFSICIRGRSFSNGRNFDSLKLRNLSTSDMESFDAGQLCDQHRGCTA